MSPSRGLLALLMGASAHAGGKRLWTPRRWRARLIRSPSLPRMTTRPIWRPHHIRLWASAGSQAASADSAGDRPPHHVQRSAFIQRAVVPAVSPRAIRTTRTIVTRDPAAGGRHVNNSPHDAGQSIQPGAALAAASAHIRLIPGSHQSFPNIHHGTFIQPEGRSRPLGAAAAAGTPV